MVLHHLVNDLKQKQTPMIQVLLKSQDLPFGQESESESEGELGRQWSTELRELKSEWEKEEKPEEQKKKGFLSGLKSKLSEATQRKPIEPGLF